MPPARPINRRSALAGLGGRPAGFLAPLILACLALGGETAVLGAAEVQAEANQADQAAMDPARAAFFEKKVRPLLSANCFECHGPNEQKGGLRLDSHQSLLAGGDSGPAVAPGKPDESLLVDAVRYGQVYQMPPTGKLPPDEVAVLVEWVRLGVPWPNAEVRPAPAGGEASGEALFSDDEKSFWAFQTPVKSAAGRLPEVREPAWCKSPIDYFVLAGLEQHGLRPAPAADKRTLIRRATFDLIGLPPDQADVEAFLADTSPDAFDKVIDRLLASPHYGERWGRHWLDVARYADSNGLDENLAYVNAWRYRDYVVAAFNSDTPYDQFIIEQLAGDLLPSSGIPAVDHQRLVATGFLTLGAKMLAEDDPVKMEMDIIDEQIDTVGGALLGLTLGCARCHDHKFDPLPTSDYYSLAGIFKSTQTMDNFRVVAQWHERPLAPADEIARVEAHREQLSAKKSQLDDGVKQANQAIVADARRRAGDYLRSAARLQRQGQRPGPLLAGGEQQPEGTLLFEAEKFDRGNVKIDFESYGAGIGVIYNQGELPNVAEYDFELSADGIFQVELRYAAAEPRPVQLLLDGAVVEAEAANQATGSWQPAQQAWFAEAVCRLPAGKHTLRLERDGPFPHFDRLALVPLGDGDAAARYTTPAELARELGLNQAVLDQWSQYLLADRQDPSSAWSIWQARQQQRDQPASVGEQSTQVELTPLAAALLGEPHPQSEEELIERQARLLESAEQAVEQQAAVEKGEKQPPLPDAALEALRHVLYDPAGPARLPDKPERFYPAEVAKELEGLRGELAAIEKQAPPELPAAMAVEEGQPSDLRIHVRGSHLALGAAVPRRFPRILAGEDQPPLPSDRSGRLELARWITRPDHPLTSRVMVNRIWRGHFGEALVRTPDNFGRLGDRPANPACRGLLDWLAVRFVEEGWSVKAMHKLIMLSSTYQMSSAYNEQAAQADPDNRLHWRMNRRRLEAEAIRDSILAAGGSLDRAMGGSLLGAKPREYVAGTASVNLARYDFQRRSIYLPVIRSALYEVFQAFDFAEPSVLNGNRASTTVAPQALFMMNSDLVDDATEQMAAGLLARADLDDAGRVESLYQRALGRPARPEEVQRGLQFVERVEATLAGEPDERRRLRAWQSLCRVVVSTNEFIYIE